MNALNRRSRWTAALFGLALLVPAAESEDQYSEANRLLFDRDHLSNVEGSPTLIYELERGGAEGEAFTDRIKVHLTRNADGETFKAEVDYLTGKRQRYFPGVAEAEGNPVLKAFLQREVVTMEDETGGNWRYFQKAIKRALANDAQVEDVTFRYEGRSVEGKRVHLVPYREGKHSARLGEFSGAEYDLVLSEAVPGELYRMEARVPAAPGASEDTEPLMIETLTLKEVKVDGQVAKR